MAYTNLIKPPTLEVFYAKICEAKLKNITWMVPHTHSKYFVIKGAIENSFVEDAIQLARINGLNEGLIKAGFLSRGTPNLQINKVQKLCTKQASCGEYFYEWNKLLPGL